MMKSIENEAFMEECRKKAQRSVLGGMAGGVVKEKTCNKFSKLTGLSNSGG